MEKGIIELLVSMLDGETEEIIINVSAAIEEIIKTDSSYSAIVRKCSGIPLLIKALTIENEVRRRCPPTLEKIAPFVII